MHPASPRDVVVDPSVALAIIAAFVGSVAPASAQLTLISTDRTVGSAGQISEDGVVLASSSKGFTGPPAGLWNDIAGMNVRYDAGTVDGSGSQNSDITATRLTFSGIADAAAAGYERQDIDPDGNPITVFGQAGGSSNSRFIVSFKITEQSPWRVQASAFRIAGSASAEVSLANGIGDILFNISDSSDDFTLNLPADEYTLTAAAAASAFAFGNDFSAGRSEFTGSFELVPAPSSAALLGIGSIATIRRRRP
jgi:hypothetical protein